MRQLLIQVPEGQGDEVLDIAEKHHGLNLACIPARDGENPTDLVLVHVSNSKVEGLLNKIQDIKDARITLIPRGVIVMHPPVSEVPQQVTSVQPRSPVEIFMASLQSTGSWQGFLAYAAVAGVVVWIGMYTGTVFLLVAAMLLAPFASPAMNTAIATARGDGTLLWHSLLRYFASLLSTIAVTAALSFIFGQETATSLMVDTSHISTVAVLLPLAAGAAGALNLAQSDRSSLVSGAAVGVLVAASIAPPAGLIGMATALGDWGMVWRGLFVLVLQLVGINLSGSLTFRMFDVSAEGAYYHRGKKWVFPVVLAVTVVALAGMLVFQLSSPTELQRSSKAQRAGATVQEVVNESNVASLVEANTRFTRQTISGQNTLLGVVYVQRREGASQSSEEIRMQLTRAIEQRLLEEQENIVPLIDVNVLEPPEKK